MLVYIFISFISSSDASYEGGFGKVITVNIIVIRNDAVVTIAVIALLRLIMLRLFGLLEGWDERIFIVIFFIIVFIRGGGGVAVSGSLATGVIRGRGAVYGGGWLG